MLVASAAAAGAMVRTFNLPVTSWSITQLKHHEYEQLQAEVQKLKNDNEQLSTSNRDLSYLLEVHKQALAKLRADAMREELPVPRRVIAVGDTVVWRHQYRGPSFKILVIDSGYAFAVDLDDPGRRVCVPLDAMELKP